MIKPLIQAVSLALALGLTLPAVGSPSAVKESKVRAEQEKSPASTNSGRSQVPADKQGEKKGDQVSINSASAQELASALNGVGMKKAESIVSYREKYGPFTQLEQLKEVPGMGNALVERNLAQIKL